MILDERLPFMPLGPDAREQVGDGAWRLADDPLLLVLLLLPLLEFMEPSIEFKCVNWLAVNRRAKVVDPQLRRIGYRIIQSIDNGTQGFVAIAVVMNRDERAPGSQGGDWWRVLGWS
jgi:hypothetical protein